MIIFTFQCHLKIQNKIATNNQSHLEVTTKETGYNDS